MRRRQSTLRLSSSAAAFARDAAFAATRSEGRDVGAAESGRSRRGRVGGSSASLGPSKGVDYTPPHDPHVVKAAGSLLQDILQFFEGKGGMATTPAILARFKSLSEGHAAFEFRELLQMVATCKGGVWRLKPDWGHVDDSVPAKKRQR